MNKEEWRKSWIDNIKHTNWEEKSFLVNKVQFDGPINTLHRLAPEVLRIIKKPIK
ncbi:hypothetical protein [Gracilibacillus phocaeensis]|uniref:hypothetical protein n=1 Tax=Gracilibacillus phocaeensis TaxID=2042304 RepID=UPI0013EF0018|nr:hypothetical protein [Gracilibacillus phocaeensis]